MASHVQTKNIDALMQQVVQLHAVVIQLAQRPEAVERRVDPPEPAGAVSDYGTTPGGFAASKPTVSTTTEIWTIGIFVAQ